MDDPLKQWKLSPMDLASRTHWVDYSRAKDAMFAATDLPGTPWWVVEADDKRRARVNCIAHLLSLLPYDAQPETRVVLPPRQPDTGYVRPPSDDAAPRARPRPRARRHRSRRDVRARYFSGDGGAAATRRARIAAECDRLESGCQGRP